MKSQQIKKLVVGNWKMNGTRALVDEMALALGGATDSLAACDVVVCPPYVYLEHAAARVPVGVSIGSQGAAASLAKSGAQTGDVSPLMLAELGCKGAILGHSERRARYHEHDADIASAAQSCLDHGITPIICVGETAQQRASGHAADIVCEMARASVPGGVQADKIIVAYEPVWAIGAGQAAQISDITEMMGQVRTALRERLDNPGGLRMLYGASVNGGNARDILGAAHVDGVLVGGASIKVDEFLAVIRAAATFYRP